MNQVTQAIADSRTMSRRILPAFNMVCLLMLCACGPSVSDEAIIVDAGTVSEGDTQALTLSQSHGGFNLLAMLYCPSPGRPLRVVSRYLITEPLSLNSDTLTIDGEEFPLAIQVGVDGDLFLVEETETTINLEDDDPDPGLHHNEITIYADTTSNDLLEALSDAEWIEISALGVTWAAAFPPEPVKKMLGGCETTLRAPPFDASRGTESAGETAAEVSGYDAGPPSGEATRRMEGEWRGRYYEGAGHINFRMQLTRQRDTFKGSSYEPNTWVVDGPDEISARIEGSVDGRRIQFTKTYEPVAGIDETISYQGEFVPGDAEIAGQWTMTGRTGRFRMWQ